MVKLLNELDEIPQDKKVIIDFFAEWCGPCNRISPQYVELADKYTNIEFCKCDVDESSALSEAFNINALPSFVFLNDGKVVNKLEGADIDGLKKLIEELNNIKTVTKVENECCECTVEECTGKKVCDKEDCNKESCDKET